ncbi:hypothetical protein [Lactobacillus psittaci]
MIKDNENYNENVKANTAFLNELKEKLPEFFGGGYGPLRLRKVQASIKRA